MIPGPGDAVVLIGHMDVRKLDSLGDETYLIAEPTKSKKKKDQPEGDPKLFDVSLGIYLGEMRVMTRDKRGGGWHGKGNRHANTVSGRIAKVYHAFYFNEKVVMIDLKLVRVCVQYSETKGKETE